jgi:hypothetical protein
MGWTDYPLCLPNCVTYYGPPPVSTDHTAARLLEDEIERRGKVSDYAGALAEMVGVGDDFWYDATGGDVWQIIRATPEQRARAFLEAVET